MIFVLKKVMNVLMERDVYQRAVISNANVLHFLQEVDVRQKLIHA